MVVLIARVFAHSSNRRSVGNPTTTTDALTTHLLRGVLRLERATATAAAHVSATRGLLVEVVGSDDGLGASLFLALEALSLLGFMVLKDLLDFILPIAGQTLTPIEGLL